MKLSKVNGLMGFAARSRNLVTGYDTCLRLIGSGRIKLLIISEDVGEKTREKMVQKCTSRNIEWRTFGKAEELSEAVGKTDKGLFGITDKGFAESIAKEIDRIQSEREVTDSDESSRASQGTE